MPDRVKEAIFNSLGARYGSPGLLPALRVADMFAGSGSLGLEALSRGASSCCFMETDVNALAALRQNVDTLRAGSAATIVDRDAWMYGVSAAAKNPFDLIFLDPPYRDSEDVTGSGAVGQFLRQMDEHASKETLILLHHPLTAVFDAPRTDGWIMAGPKKIGSNAITLFSR